MLILVVWRQLPPCYYYSEVGKFVGKYFSMFFFSICILYLFKSNACHIGLHCGNAVNCLHSLQVCLYSSVSHHNRDYFSEKIQSHPSRLMSVLRGTLLWTWLIRDLCSGRGFRCCKLAFTHSLLNCQLFSLGFRHFSSYIKSQHLSQ